MAERSFAREVQDLRLKAGEEFRGERLEHVVVHRACGLEGATGKGGGIVGEGEQQLADAIVGAHAVAS